MDTGGCGAEGVCDVGYSPCGAVYGKLWFALVSGESFREFSEYELSEALNSYVVFSLLSGWVNMLGRFVYVLKSAICYDGE